MNAAANFTARFARSPLRAELPLDVRVMNSTTAAVVLLAVVVAAGAAAGWIARQPYFTIRGIRLEGDVTRNSVATIRANAAPRLAGSFFTMDLQAARQAFEAVPWVRHAVVHKVWPNRLLVRLEEHKPVAVWLGDEGNDRLVNSHGEIFDANVGDVDDERLPEFDGNEGQAPTMLAMYRRLTAVFRPMDLSPVRLALSDRGSWEVELDNGGVVEVGRGSEDEVIARCERFVRTVSQVAARQHRAWNHADLRHADGYALRLNTAADTGTRTN
ncbi:cell division protein FtsQ/DivIB [Ideonella azotifigens]|uniref:Cell division protein FtsQ n=1 Tax=Ideonella azotifigens TaxID=513160 RepID=A0ABP3VVM4_9BURK|nr:cell division protein FtsQ/DivIB [Ideonella azotifigens]MCD2343415.1 cell division protein FtsQ/DivIB [Ideonella azotifigens]